MRFGQGLDKGQDTDNIQFHFQKTDMDIIDSYNKLTLGKYMEIQEVSRNESLEDIDKQVQILSILTGMAEEEILHLPIQDYKELVAKSGFLDPENINYHPVAKKYLLGKFELIPCRDFRKIETCQYIDFQTYAPDLDKYLVEFLSVILVPRGHRYNEGYGVTTKGVDYAASTGVGLVIVLDCGIKAVEEIAYARERGIDFIICDHHVPDEVLPPAWPCAPSCRGCGPRLPG